MATVLNVIKLQYLLHEQIQRTTFKHGKSKKRSQFILETIIEWSLKVTVKSHVNQTNKLQQL